MASRQLFLSRICVEYDRERAQKGPTRKGPGFQNSHTRAREREREQVERLTSHPEREWTSRFDFEKEPLRASAELCDRSRAQVASMQPAEPGTHAQRAAMVLVSPFPLSDAALKESRVSLYPVRVSTATPLAARDRGESLGRPGRRRSRHRHGAHLDVDHRVHADAARRADGQWKPAAHPLGVPRPPRHGRRRQERVPPPWYARLRLSWLTVRLYHAPRERERERQSAREESF